MKDPLETGFKLIQKIEEFGEVAGLKINKNKSKLITKNLTKAQESELEDKTKISITKKIKYLGIWLTAIKEDNYDKILHQIKKDLENWENLQISFLGRTATVKMNILPKILFLFQVIPIKLGKTLFQELNKLVTKFIWQRKKTHD